MKRFFVLGAACLLLAGCAEASGQTASRPLPTDPTTLTLIVTTHQQPGAHGTFYPEGAVPQVRLVDADGNRIAARADHDGTFTFDDLAPGRYVIDAALRPCDGNCGYLDPPVDGCQQPLDIDADAKSHVEFTVGEPCDIS